MDKHWLVVAGHNLPKQPLSRTEGLTPTDLSLLRRLKNRRNPYNQNQKMRKKKLKPGQQAPYFEKRDSLGNLIKLSDYEHKKLLLSFFRYAGCPWCNLALHRLVLQYPKYQELGLSIVVFIQSSPENIQKNIYDRHNPVPPFPVIADPKREVYDLYGVNESLGAAVKSIRKAPAWLRSHLGNGYKQTTIDGSMTLVPAQFLIGQYNLRIYKIHYGVDYFDHLSLGEILEFAQFGAE